MAKRTRVPSRRSSVGPANCWKPEPEPQEITRMARGKHSSAAMYRRAMTAEADVKVLRTDNRELHRKLEVAERVVARVDAVEARCKELQCDLDLATSDELRTVQKQLATSDDHIEHLIRWFVDVLRAHDTRLDADEWESLHRLCGAELFSSLICDDEPENREARRARQHNSAGFTRTLLDGDFHRRAAKLQHRTGMPALAVDLPPPSLTDVLAYNTARRRHDDDAAD